MFFRKGDRKSLIRIETLMRHRILQEKKKSEKIQVLKDIINMLREENSQLKDRLMARDIPELKTYTFPSEVSANSVYRPEEDDELAGSVVSFETD